ncbi:MAG: flagellar biosynthetic protein FliO [Candidatus Marinimicrobia bacterium]|nr:flagellar biosynthetic protein FliO [Candidatus Neomarinimicrobiota bacterium]
MNKTTKPAKMNFIALLFVLIAIAGVFLTIDPAKKNRGRDEKVEKLKEIAADTTIKNIKVEYKEADRGEFTPAEDLPRISDYNKKFFQSMVTMIILLVVFLLIAYFFKHKGKNNTGTGTGIKITDRKYLGPKQYLAIVIVEGERLLLGITDQSINLLKKLPQTDLSDETDNDQSAEAEDVSFPKILGKIRLKQND